MSQTRQLASGEVKRALKRPLSLPWKTPCLLPERNLEPLPANGKGRTVAAPRGTSDCNADLYTGEPGLLVRDDTGRALEDCQPRHHQLPGIKSAELIFDAHTLFVGVNNVGKSTICEALDLALGADRLNGVAPIDEFDFYNANYLEPRQEGQP